MRALVLGAQGMLGSMLCEVLSDWDLTCWDKEQLDITNQEDVYQKVIEERPEAIINAAAYTDVDGAEDEENQELCFAVNETAVRNIALVAKEMGVPMVHYSTDYVFAGDNPEGYAESDPPGPAVNVYGQSKMAGERALKEVGPVFYLLRTAWLYGPSVAPSGAMDGKPRNFVDAMLQLGETRDTVDVVDDQHGSPTFTKDVALATRAVWEDESFAPGIYHATGKGQTTWAGFAQKIFELANVYVDVKPVTSDQFPRPAKRPAYSILKNTHGPQMRPWEDALEEYLSLQL